MVLGFLSSSGHDLGPSSLLKFDEYCRTYCVVAGLTFEWTTKVRTCVVLM